MTILNRTYVDAYTGHNVGDDLFLKLLFERYPDKLFLLCGDRRYKKIFAKYKNVSVISREPFLFYNKICRLIKVNRLSAENIVASLCKNAIEIGGSLFMEPSVPILCNGTLRKIPYVVLGANFGPYTERNYLEKCRNFFCKAEAVCFRDKKSYDTFADLKNTDFSPDIVFNLRLSSRKPIKQLFISVMNFTVSNTYNASHQQVYEQFLTDMADNYLNQGGRVVICSFCEQEGDEIIARRLCETLKMRSNVECILYKDDLGQILEEIQKSEEIIATRFHSLILGLISGRRVYPICYSDKSREVLADLGLKEYGINLSDLHGVKINQMVPCQMGFEEIEAVRKKAEKQFEGIEKCLMN